MRGYSHGRRKSGRYRDSEWLKRWSQRQSSGSPLNGRCGGAERVPRLRVWSGVQTGHSGAERAGLGSGAVVRKAFDSVQPTAFNSQAKISNPSKLPYDELIHHGSLSLNLSYTRNSTFSVKYPPTYRPFHRVQAGIEKNVSAYPVA